MVGRFASTDPLSPLPAPQDILPNALFFSANASPSTASPRARFAPPLRSIGVVYAPRYRRLAYPLPQSPRHALHHSAQFSRRSATFPLSSPFSSLPCARFACALSPKARSISNPHTLHTAPPTFPRNRLLRRSPARRRSRSKTAALTHPPPKR